MSDQENLNESNDGVQMSELDMLKARARMMGITFSNAIGVEALKKKIQDRLDGKDEQTATVTTAAPDTSIVFDASTVTGAYATTNVDTAPTEKPLDMSPMAVRSRLLAENMKLVRIRYTNMNPLKKDMLGEFFTVANDVIGRVTKFVPYGEASENGFHVPYCIYKMMKNKKYNQIRTNQKKGQEQIDVAVKLVSEFAIEILPPLTPTEIAKLAAAQSAAGGLD